MVSTNYNDFCSNVNGYFRTVTDNLDTVVVNRDKDNVAVLMSLGEYNSIMETLYLMSSPETMEDIKAAEADIKAGKGIEVDINELSLWKSSQ